MALDRRDWTTDAVEVGWTRTMDAVGYQRNLVVNALSDRQSVQRVTKYRIDVLVESSASDEVCSESSASDEVCSGVQYGLYSHMSVCHKSVFY